MALRHLEDEPDPLPDDVPVAVRELISQAMAKHPDDRFASASDFADAALAATAPLDYKSLTGTSLTAPLSPAPADPGGAVAAGVAARAAPAVARQAIRQGTGRTAGGDLPGSGRGRSGRRADPLPRRRAATR